MYTAVAGMTAFFGVFVLYGVALVVRGLLGERVRLRKRDKGGAKPVRSWFLVWLGLAVAGTGCLLAAAALREVMILEPNMRMDIAGTGITLGVGLVGVVWLIRAVVGNRSKGSRRCPKCWYSMEGVAGRRCPECGREAESERAMLRSRRSKFAVVLATLLSLAAPAGIIGQAYLAEHSASDAIPTWVLARVVDLPDGSLRRSAYQTLNSRILYGGLPPDTRASLERRFIGRILANDDNCWDRTYWWLLISCRERTDEPMSFEDIEAIEMQRARRAWARMSDPDPATRDWNAGVTRAARSTVQMYAEGAVYDRQWREQRGAIRDRANELLARTAPAGRLPQIAENLASGNEMLVTGTLELMAGSSAAPYADDLFALFDESSERRPIGTGMTAADVLRIPMMEDPLLFERLRPLLESTDPVDVTFVAKLLATPLNQGPERKFWVFPGWREWLWTALRTGPAESAHQVQFALLGSGGTQAKCCRFRPPASGPSLRTRSKCSRVRNLSMSRASWPFWTPLTGSPTAGTRKPGSSSAGGSRCSAGTGPSRAAARRNC
jgi:hypothetical protein